jgi:integrase
MARQMNKLSPLQVNRISTPGWHGDGGGLWLQLTPPGSRSWVFRYTLQGKQKVLGLGATHTISLAEAREKARKLRQQLLEGIDPGEARKATKEAAALARAKRITFDECVKAFIDSKKHEWTNLKHTAQWEATLTAYCSPHIGKLDVSDVDTDLVLKCLKPIWTDKTETASRVRQRMEAVLSYATTAGHRRGENPARWKGHLEHLLAKASRVAKVRNHPSLPWARMPAFMRAIAPMDGNAALALQFAILTACRSGEVRGATWGEIDMEKAIWTIPPERMKAKKEHTVPLSPAAVDVLKRVVRFEDEELVFPGAKRGSQLSDMSLAACIKRMNDKELIWTDEQGVAIVPHGFRSTFRMWAAEASNFPREVAEHALAHQLPDKVEAAYQRGSQFTKRIKLMEQWAAWCTSPATKGNVATIGKREVA